MIIDAWAQHPTQRHLQLPVFDSLGKWVSNDKANSQLNAIEMPLSVTLESMDQGGVSVSLLSAWVGPQGELTSNDEVASFVSEAPDRLVGVGSVDIAHPMSS